MESTSKGALAPVELPKPNISSIKNKQRRTELYRKMKKEQRKVISKCNWYYRSLV